MSDAVTGTPGTPDPTDPAGASGVPATPAGDEFKPITSQADLDRILTARLARERAKFEDYDAIKSELASLKEEGNRELDELRQAKAKSDKDAADLKAENLRLTVASEKGVPAKLLTGSTRRELEDAAEELLKFRGNPAPNAGDEHHGPLHGLDQTFTATDREATARALFGLS